MTHHMIASYFNGVCVTTRDKTIINVIIVISKQHKSTIILRHYLSLSILTWLTVLAIITE